MERSGSEPRREIVHDVHSTGNYRHVGALEKQRGAERRLYSVHDEEMK